MKRFALLGVMLLTVGCGRVIETPNMATGPIPAELIVVDVPATSTFTTSVSGPLELAIPRGFHKKPADGTATGTITVNTLVCDYLPGSNPNDPGLYLVGCTLAGTPLVNPFRQTFTDPTINLEIAVTGVPSGRVGAVVNFY